MPAKPAARAQEPPAKRARSAAASKAAAPATTAPTAVDPPSPNALRNALVQVGFIAVAALVVYGFVQAAQEDQRRSACSALCALGPDYAGRNRTAPDFELPDMDGKMVKLSDFRGKTVILNFWTITCNPCKQEMPSFVTLQKQLKGRKDVVLLTVSTDDGPDDVRDQLSVLLDGEDKPIPILFDPDLKVTRDKYGTELYPETWIIDPKGIIRARFDGSRDWSGATAENVINMASGKGLSCVMSFQAGRPVGAFGNLCDSD